MSERLSRPEWVALAKGALAERDEARSDGGPTSAAWCAGFIAGWCAVLEAALEAGRAVLRDTCFCGRCRKEDDHAGRGSC